MLAYLLTFICDTCYSKKWYLINYSGWCFVCNSNWNLIHGWPDRVCFNYASGALSELIETLSKWNMNVTGLSSHCMEVLFNFTKKPRRNERNMKQNAYKPKWNWIKNIRQDLYSGTLSVKLYELTTDYLGLNSCWALIWSLNRSEEELFNKYLSIGPKPPFT